MKLLYLRESIEELERLDRTAQRQIKESLKELHRAPPGGHVPLALKGAQFKGLYKLRVGDWRLIYKMDGGALIFVKLGHRADVYEKS